MAARIEEKQLEGPQPGDALLDDPPAFLAKLHVAYLGKTAWTRAHHTWLRGQRFDLSGLQAAFDAAHEAVVAVEDHRDRLDEATHAMAPDSEFTNVAQRLACLRGVSTLTAFGVAVEIGDWTRLDGRRIGSYLGLVQTETSCCLDKDTPYLSVSYMLIMGRS